jgi:PAS domain S-box-containing protein
MLNPTDIAAVLAAVGAGLLFLQRRVQRRLEQTNAELRAEMAQRAAAERVLADSEERLALSLEGSGLALFDWDIASGEVYLSEQWSAMIGGNRAPTATAIATLQRSVHADDVAVARRELIAVLKGESAAYRVDVRVRTQAGRWKWIAIHGKVVARDAKGRALRLVGTNADITQRKAMEQLKGEFAATIAHELRTPLTAMQGSLGLVREGSAGDIPAPARDLIDMAYANCQRLSQLIQNMVDVEKLQSGLLELRICGVELRSLLPLAIESNARLARKLGVQLELVEPIPAEPIAADPERLLQVLAHLLSNATKFSPSGKTVTLSANRVAGARIRIGVRDRGSGIPETFKERVFENFSQADASDTRQRDGTGVGLSISRALIERAWGAPSASRRIPSGVRCFTSS